MKNNGIFSFLSIAIFFASSVLSLPLPIMRSSIVRDDGKQQKAVNSSIKLVKRQEQPTYNCPMCGRYDFYGTRVGAITATSATDCLQKCVEEDTRGCDVIVFDWRKTTGNCVKYNSYPPRTVPVVLPAGLFFCSMSYNGGGNLSPAIPTCPKKQLYGSRVTTMTLESAEECTRQCRNNLGCTYVIMKRVCRSVACTLFQPEAQGNPVTINAGESTCFVVNRRDSLLVVPEGTPATRPVTNPNFVPCPPEIPAPRGSRFGTLSYQRSSAECNERCIASTNSGQKCTHAISRPLNALRIQCQLFREDPSSTSRLNLLATESACRVETDSSPPDTNPGPSPGPPNQSIFKDCPKEALYGVILRANVRAANSLECIQQCIDTIGCTHANSQIVAGGRFRCNLIQENDEREKLPDPVPRRISYCRPPKLPQCLIGSIKARRIQIKPGVSVQRFDDYKDCIRTCDDNSLCRFAMMTLVNGQIECSLAAASTQPLGLPEGSVACPKVQLKEKLFCPRPVLTGAVFGTDMDIKFVDDCTARCSTSTNCNDALVRLEGSQIKCQFFKRDPRGKQYSYRFGESACPKTFNSDDVKNCVPRTSREIATTALSCGQWIFNGRQLGLFTAKNRAECLAKCNENALAGCDTFLLRVDKDVDNCLIYTSKELGILGEVRFFPGESLCSKSIKCEKPAQDTDGNRCGQGTVRGDYIENRQEAVGTARECFRKCAGITECTDAMFRFDSISNGGAGICNFLTGSTELYAYRAGEVSCSKLRV